MKKFEFDENVKLIIEKSQNVAANRYNTNCTSAHAFLAVVATLKQLAARDGEPYIKYFETFKEIMNQNGLTGESFKNAMDAIYPHGVAPSSGEKFKINCGVDLRKIIQNLKALAARDLREITIVDFINELFSDYSYDVYQVMNFIIGSSACDTICKEMKEAFKIFQPKVMSIEDLENIKELTNLNQYVAEHPMTFVNCDPVIDQLRLALSCKAINCAALVGKAGTGKTNAVYAFVDAINKGQCEGFNDKIIYQLDISSVVSGSKFRGEFEEKLLNIIEGVKKYQGKVILFCDEFHTICGSGSSSDGSMDGANIMKPYITRGELQIIGATTNDEYSKHVMKDKAFARRFHQIHVKEPNKEETKQILLGLADSYSEFHGKKISDTLIDEVINLAYTYNVADANPARSINIFDVACAHAKIFNKQNELVMDEDARKAIQIQFAITINKDRANKTEKVLKEKILGQNEAIKTICSNLRAIDLKLVDPEKPKYSAICAGSTGTGKTFLSQIIAKEFFGSETCLVKINMGEYSTEQDVTKITGSAPGYIGYDEEPQLIREVKEKGACLVLFDEIEKAHPKVFDTLLSILDTGEMKTNKGDSVSFKDCMILFTTNLGYEAGFSKGGFAFSKGGKNTSDVIETVKKHFRPEFINRLNDIIIFNSLTNDIAETLIRRYHKEFEDYSGVKVKLFKTDFEEICKEAEIEEYGARGLKRAVQKQLLKKAMKQRKPSNV